MTPGPTTATMAITSTTKGKALMASITISHNQATKPVSGGSENGAQEGPDEERHRDPGERQDQVKTACRKGPGEDVASQLVGPEEVFASGRR